MSTIKVDNIDSKDSTGNITISRPLVATLTSGSINNLNNLLTPANASVTAAKMATTDTLPAWNGSALTNLPAPADNSVTGAKLNISLLAGDTMYASGTDTLAKLAKGTATQVLTMNTGATAPEWADAGGGAWEVKSSGSFNDVVNVDFTINSTKAQRIYIHGLNTFTSGTTTPNTALLGIRTAPTSANSFATGGSDYYCAYWEIINGTTNRGGNSGNENRIVITGGNMFGNAITFNGELEISIPKPQPETGQRPLVSVRLHSIGNPGNDHWWAYTSGSRQNSENIYSLRLYSHSASRGLKGSYVHTELG